MGYTYCSSEETKWFSMPVWRLQSPYNQYPLPRPEEPFSALNNGQHFTKLDLSEAYLQVEESQKYLVINTHKGLFHFNRLPYGVASAPAIFQQIMEQVTEGCLLHGRHTDYCQ